MTIMYAKVDRALGVSIVDQTNITMNGRFLTLVLFLYLCAHKFIKDINKEHKFKLVSLRKAVSLGCIKN